MKFSENAKVISDEFSMCAEILDIIVDDAGDDGNSSFIREICAQNEASFVKYPHRGKADTIRIYPMKKIMILEGNAEVADADGNTIRGEILQLDGTSKQFSVHGGTSERSSIFINDPSKFAGASPENNFIKLK